MLQKSRRCVLLFCLLLVAIAASGCYVATIETGAAPSDTKIERKWAHGFLWGLVPPSVTVARSKCKSGVASVQTQHSFLNGLVAVITYGSMDRMTREPRDFENLQEKLRSKGALFFALKQNWDMTTPEGELLTGQQLLNARYERRVTSVRVRQKCAWRAEQGLPNGGPQMLGYDLDPDHPGVPVVNETEKRQVRMIFDEYLRIGGVKRTAEFVNKMGSRTKSYLSRRGKQHGGRKFSDTTIHRILTNPIYLGKFRFHGEVMQGRHEQIVPDELFEKVQRILAGNRGKRGRPRKRVALLEGLVRCKSCGSHMTPTFGNNAQAKAYFYYQCSHRQHQGNDACGMMPVAAEPLEEIIADYLIELGKQDRTIDALVKEAMAERTELQGNLTARRQDLTVQRRRVQDQVNNLVASLKAGVAGLKPILQEIGELHAQAEQLDEEILALEVEIDAVNQKAVSARSMTESLTTFGDLYQEATPEERRDLIRFRVNQIIWSPDEIKLGLLDLPPARYQEFDEVQQMVARTGFEPVLPA